MIDLQKTIEKSKVTAYRIASDLGIAQVQVWRWATGKQQPRRMSEKVLRDYFKEMNIEIIEKQ